MKVEYKGEVLEQEVVGVIPLEEFLKNMSELFGIEIIIKEK